MDNIDRFLKEDLGREGDKTSESLFTNEDAQAEIIAKEDCIVSGLEEMGIIFERTGAETKLQVNDGDFVTCGHRTFLA